MGDAKVKNRYTLPSRKMNDMLQSNPVCDKGHEEDIECSKKRKRDDFLTGPGKGNNEAFLEDEMVFGLDLAMRIGF